MMFPPNNMKVSLTMIGSSMIFFRSFTGYHNESSDSYPIISENRKNGITLIRVNGPHADKTQDFWRMVVEKRIPTIQMTCDYVEGNEFNNQNINL